ncbi:MAG: hypothetical protein JW703_01830, partial [Candidatus Diapherotrites archaeon]|nr:hypothetical protein [Candidatus Diapherotrites archaeon]
MLLVQGIKEAYAKLGIKRNFEVVEIPVSRENIDGNLAKQRIREAVSGIPAGAIVYYVDEAVSGRNAYGNFRDLLSVLNGRKIKMHLLMSSGLIHYDPRVRREFSNYVKHKRMDITLHPIESDIPWTDSARHLGFNWGLKHVFPVNVLAASVNKRILKKWKKEFEKKYEELIVLGKERKFRWLSLNSPFYNRRHEFAAKAFEDSALSLGIQVKRIPSQKKISFEVNGLRIDFPDLKLFSYREYARHVHKKGTPVVHSKRYSHTLQADPDVLLQLPAQAVKNYYGVLKRRLISSVKQKSNRIHLK